MSSSSPRSSGVGPVLVSLTDNSKTNPPMSSSPRSSGVGPALVSLTDSKTIESSNTDLPPNYFVSTVPQASGRSGSIALVSLDERAKHLSSADSVTSQPGLLNLETTNLGISDYRFLSNLEGIVIYKKSKCCDWIGNICCTPNVYKLSAWSEKTEPKKYTNGYFDTLPVLIDVREDSTCCNRICCDVLRPMKLGFFPPILTDKTGYPDNVLPYFWMDKPCRIPCIVGCCVICPQTIIAKSTETQGHKSKNIGFASVYASICTQVQYYFCLTYYISVRTGNVSGIGSTYCDTPSFYLRLSECFGTSKCNFCAPSCVNKESVIDIMDSRRSKVLSTIHRHFLGRCCLCGCQSDYQDHYIMKFPKSDVSLDDRVTLLGGLMLVEFVRIKASTLWDDILNTALKLI